MANLRVTIDLGDSPPLDLVAAQTRILGELYEECFQAEVLIARRKRGDQSCARGPIFHGDPSKRDLLISRTSLASPWTVVLTEAVSATPYAASVLAGGFGSLRALRYLLELKRDWDTHRLEKARGEVELQRLRLALSVETITRFRETLANENDLTAEQLDTGPPGRILTSNLRDLYPVIRVETMSNDGPRA